MPGSITPADPGSVRPVGAAPRARNDVAEARASLHSPAVKLAQAPIARRERRPTSIQGFIALEDGRTAEILLLDLSYEGCGIEVPVELRPGETIRLSALRRGAIEAEVRWYARGKAGLVFRAEEASTRPRRPRNHERRALTAEVSIRRLGKANFRVGVSDLSSHGCKVELVERPSVGEHVLVKFDRLEVLEAEVCWVDGYCGGLRFEKPIHPAVFDLLFARLTVGGARQ